MEHGILPANKDEVLSAKFMECLATGNKISLEKKNLWTDCILITSSINAHWKNFQIKIVF